MPQCAWALVAFVSDSCLEACHPTLHERILLSLGPPKVYQNFVKIVREARALGSNWLDFVEGGATISKLLPLIGQVICAISSENGALIVCWTANDCLSRPKHNKKVYNWSPGGDLQGNVHRLLTVLSGVPRCLPVLAGSSITWKVSKGAYEYDKFISRVRQDRRPTCVESTALMA